MAHVKCFSFFFRKIQLNTKFGSWVAHCVAHTHPPMYPTQHFHLITHLSIHQSSAPNEFSANVRYTRMQSIEWANVRRRYIDSLFRVIGLRHVNVLGVHTCSCVLCVCLCVWVLSVSVSYLRVFFVPFIFSISLCGQRKYYCLFGGALILRAIRERTYN